MVADLDVARAQALVGGPAVVISEMATASGLAEQAGANAVPGYNGLPIGDQPSPNQSSYKSLLSPDII